MLQVKMTRIFQPFILRSYLPSAIFVLVSWVSFTIDPSVVPGRMALLVTLLLMLINMSNGITSSIPLSKTLTAIEVWIFSCIGFVFFALFEYAILLFHLRKDLSQKNRKINFKGDNKIFVVRDRTKEKTEASNDNEPFWSNIGYTFIDTVALFAFSSAFLIFNIIYWVTYL